MEVLEVDAAALLTAGAEEEKEAPCEILIFLRPDVDVEDDDATVDESCGAGEALSPPLPLAIFERAGRFLGAFSVES